MERRPILLSSVMLRQNPHNVHEWHKRVKLFNGQPHKQILTYTEAVTTVDVAKVMPISLHHSSQHCYYAGCGIIHQGFADCLRTKSHQLSSDRRCSA